MEEVVSVVETVPVMETTVPILTVEYHCKRCKLTFNTKRESLLHKKSVHDNNPALKKYTCDICNKGFTNHGNLYRHVKGHSNQRPHECKICGRSFAQQANLQRHNSVHNGERPFVCTVCNKGFTQQGNLKRHELIHTGEKPYRCKRCGRHFSQRVNLKKHNMLHQDYRPYTCDICNKSFPVSSVYKKHMQKHYNKMNQVKTELFYECGLCRVIFNNFEDFQAHGVFCEVASEEQIETTTEQIDNDLDAS